MSLAIGIIIGLVVGALGVFAAFSRRTGAQQASIEASQAEVERMRAEAEGLRTAQQAAQAEAAAYRATAESLQVSREEDKVQFEERISTATNEVIAQGSRRLTELATERFKTEVDPIKELLERYETQVRDLEKKRELAYSSMDEHLKRLTDSEDRLRKETANLVTALRTPQTRGAWGESQLRRVVEFAGMLQHCDFVEQFSSNTDEGRLRPDMVVHMPDGARLIVDSKVPLDAYLRVVEAEDEATRRSEGREHARQLRNHVDALAKKDYSALLGSANTDFVVCFIPGEALVTAAFEADPGLLDHALSKNVLISGPVNLIALLKTVNLGWRHESLATSAAAIHDAGRLLHDRLGTFADHLGKVGNSLNSAVNSYNKAVGSMETRLLPASRAFEDLKLVTEAVASPPLVDNHAAGITRPELIALDETAALHLLEGAGSEPPEAGEA